MIQQYSNTAACFAFACIHVLAAKVYTSYLVCATLLLYSDSALSLHVAHPDLNSNNMHPWVPASDVDAAGVSANKPEIR